MSAHPFFLDEPAGELVCCAYSRCYETWGAYCETATVCEQCGQPDIRSFVALRLDLEPPADGPVSSEMIYPVEWNGDVVGRFYSRDGGIINESVFLKATEAGALGPWCVTVYAERLSDGVRSGGTEVCAGEGMTVPDDRPGVYVPNCVSPPHGVLQELGSNPDAPGTGEGCSTGSHTPARALLWLCGCAALLLRRERTRTL